MFPVFYLCIGPRTSPVISPLPAALRTCHGISWRLHVNKQTFSFSMVTHAYPAWLLESLVWDEPIRSRVGQIGTGLGRVRI